MIFITRLMCDRLAIIYKCLTYFQLLYVCICSGKNGSLLTPFITTIQISIYVGLFTICLQRMCASAGLTSWMILEFNSYVFDVWPPGRYPHMFCILQYVVCICLFRNGSLLTLFVTTIQISIYVGLFTICLHLMCVSVGLTSWMYLGFHSCVNLEVSVHVS